MIFWSEKWFFDPKDDFSKRNIIFNQIFGSETIFWSKLSFDWVCGSEIFYSSKIFKLIKKRFSNLYLIHKIRGFSRKLRNANLISERSFQWDFIDIFDINRSRALVKVPRIEFRNSRGFYFAWFSWSFAGVLRPKSHHFAIEIICNKIWLKKTSEVNGQTTGAKLICFYFFQRKLNFDSYILFL